MKKKALIPLGIIIGVFIIILFIGILGSNDNGEQNNVKQEHTNINSKKDKELIIDIDRVVADIQYQTLDIANNMYEDGSISKDQLSKLNSEIIRRTDESRNNIMKDKSYDSIVKKLEANQLTDRELQEFLEPYLKHIQDLTTYENL
ncbi:hypothetical protein BUY12_11015 [Staphylococcus chromogenes]|uniref:hypothetical protein n=1 Tax=Staphylococcus chromogenes TaxID=46126 RepID=UPI000D1C957B|nr:hypothetical protein [Staphylococcus chromogenes]PTF49802.1 hypothetical protein BUY12_11015 [Staphylococcus chromogenes]